MIHGAGKIRVRERDSSKRPIAESLTRSRISVQAEEEPRLRINKRMSPPVENDARNIALGVEARSPEHLHHLLAYLLLIFHERGRQQFRTAQATLVGQRKPRFCKAHLEVEHRGKIGANEGRIHTKLRTLRYIDKVAESLEPAPAGEAKIIEEPPVANRHVGKQVGRIMKLRIRVTPRFVQIAHHVFRHPSPASHHYGPGLDSLRPAILHVNDRNKLRLVWLSHMLHPHHRGVEPQPDTLACFIQGAEVRSEEHTSE